MARSMIRRRQEAERQRIEAFEISLRRVSSAPRPPPDFETALKEARKGFEGEIVRDAWAWRPQLKTRDPARLRLAAARHLFARYPVPAHLEDIWLDATGLDTEEVRLRKRWYLVAAQGGSLYKADAARWLTRKEVHRFLNPPGNLGFEAAFWAAIVRSYTDDMGVALKLAHSHISTQPRSALGFWREAVQFFCANPASRETVDDLCDYIAAAHRRDAAFSLKGRTIASLLRLAQEWHRTLAAIERIEEMRRRAEREGVVRIREEQQLGRTWAGSSLADWEWRPTAGEAKAKGERFLVQQLTTARELVAESSAMHHCVSTYASKCIAGYASIWALRRVSLGRTERMLTIELDRQDRAVQVRGFANRLATAEERKIIERWAKARGVALV